MSKTKEKLLKPRYKVIADWPNNRHKGATLILRENPTNWWKCDLGNQVLCKMTLDELPHLFRKMLWWEEREENEMPKYLKHTINNKTTYHKIEKWDMERMIGFGGDGDFCNVLVWAPEYTYQPATKSEYNQYIQTQNKQQ